MSDIIKEDSNFISDLMESDEFRERNRGRFWCKIPLLNEFIGLINEDEYHVHYFKNKEKCLNWLSGDDCL